MESIISSNIYIQEGNIFLTVSVAQSTSIKSYGDRPPATPVMVCISMSSGTMISEKRSLLHKSLLDIFNDTKNLVIEEGGKTLVRVAITELLKKLPRFIFTMVKMKINLW
jgi:hypothetical protein